MMQAAIITGELSGDRIGADLAASLKDALPDIKLWGIGSDAMRAMGVELVADSSTWGAISVTEAIRKVPSLLVNVAPLIRREVLARRPDVVVLIDFGAFNVRLATFCKQNGISTAYYVPPGCWKRDGFASEALIQNSDLILTPFEWSLERYQSRGVPSQFVGHPLLDRPGPSLSREQFADELGLDFDKPIIGLLPGSRAHEINHLVPVMMDAARRLASTDPGAQFVIGVAPSISADQMCRFLTGNKDLGDKFSEIWHELTQEAEKKIIRPLSRTAGSITRSRQKLLATNGGFIVPEDALRHTQFRQYRGSSTSELPPVVLAKNLATEVMTYCDALVCCSGTVTLEAAVIGTPMIIVYRGSKIMEIEYKLRGLHRKIKFIGLPNIVLNRKAVPELIQEEASAAAIAEHISTLLRDITVRQAMKNDFKEIRKLLGAPGASDRAAAAIIDLVKSKRTSQ